MIRRVASAIFLGVLFVSGLRLSGHSASPPQRGGWRPLQLPDPDELATASGERDHG